MGIYKACVYDLNIIEALNKTDFEKELKEEICDYISDLKKQIEEKEDLQED